MYNKANKRTFYQGNVNVQNEILTSLTLDFQNIKGLSGKIEIPLKNNVCGIVGSNVLGKSTIMSLLSKLVPPYTFRLTELDYTTESSIIYQVYNTKETWKFDTGKSKKQSKNEDIRFYGRYEGSLFFGKRFDDSSIVDRLVSNGEITDDLIENAEDYVIKSLGSILHGNDNHYKSLKKIKNNQIAKKLNIKNLPYFYNVNGKLISQYRMSSGECLLLTLLHFLYHSVVRKSIPSNQHALLLIDEIELALHPIAVKRLIENIKKISEESINLTCIVSSHSLEVIRSIPASNLFNIQNETNNEMSRCFRIENPIYPCYLMKDIYSHNGFDFVILVEDDLAAKIVDHVLLKLKLRHNKLINVVPVGGWANVFNLHKTLSCENTLGISTKIISIIDGDVKDDANKKFKNLQHLFLPVASIEKFVLKELLTENSNIKKAMKDTLFTGTTSIELFVQEYIKEEEQRKNQGDEEDKSGKRIYRKLKHFCQTERSISEDKLIDVIFHIIEQHIDLVDFEKSISTINEFGPIK